MASRMSRGGIDILKLHTVDLDAPLVRGLVQDRPEFAVDRIPGRQRGVQVHLADDVTEGRLGELLDGFGKVRDLVHGLDRVRNLEVQKRIDLRDHIVVGDHVLSRKIVHRLPKIDPFHGLPFGDDITLLILLRIFPGDGSRLVDDRPDDVDP